jgi:chaperonin GroEL
MELGDIIYYGADAQLKLKAGINKLADVVKVTLGPAGKSVILGDPSGIPVVTKDGVSVANYIKLIDPVENAGAQLLKQVSGKTVEDAGDGTTTSIVLAQAIINNAIEVNNSTKYRKYLEKYKDFIIDNLTKLKRDITVKDKELLHKIAYTSSNGDADIADTVVKAIQAVGLEGIINVVNSDNDTTKITIESGYRLNRGYANSSFINDPDKGTCEIGNAHVMIFKDRVEDFKSLKPALTNAMEDNKALVIIAKEYSEDVIFNCAQNFIGGKARIIPLLAADYNDQMIFNLEDIAVYTDATVLTQAQLKAGVDVRVGLIDVMTVSKDYTTFQSSANVEGTIVRVKQLNNLVKEAKSKFDVAKLEQRIARLTTGVATIEVGGITPAETQERYDRYEDAVGAVLAAVKSSVLPGGGIALYRVGGYMMGLDLIDDEEVAVVDNLIKSLAAPFKQILHNADIHGVKLKSKDFFTGYSIEKDKEIDFMKEGILDPFLVTVSALTNAISIASMIISTGAVTDNSAYLVTN